MNNEQPSYREPLKVRKQPKISKSSVDPRFVVHPITGKQICGSFKAHMKERYDEEGLFPEELLQDVKLFEEFLCQDEPEKNKGWHNGRCRRHGSRSGKRPIHGKYSAHFTRFTPEELTILANHSHDELNEELGLISHFIKEKLPDALEEAPTSADKRLHKLILRSKEAIEKLDLTFVAQCLGEMELMCETNYQKEAAKKDIVELTKTYASIFETEIKTRALKGEYLKRERVAHDYIIIFNTCALFMRNDEEREALRRKLHNLVTTGVIFGLPANNGTDNKFIGLEDQNETENSLPIGSELSSASL